MTYELLSSAIGVPASPSPFAASPLLRTRDRESLAESLWSAYGAVLTEAGPAGLAVANRIRIGSVQLHYCRYDAPVRIRFSDMSGLRRFQPLSGAGRIAMSGRRVEIDPQRTAIIPDGSTFEAAYGEGYQHIVSQFDEAALRKKAEAITGVAVAGALAIRTLEPIPMQAQLRSGEIIAALARMLAHEGGEIDQPIIEMAQALASAFLLETVPGFSAALAAEPKRAARSSVAVLEDYIQANWNRALTVEEIAEACGVSIRSVFARFKDQKGVAPLTYLRDLRLQKARQRLIEGGSDGSVISVALACGFSSFGHFARRYRERFGELPSETLARQR
jgi:AraC-like DNA-binding protein